MKEGRRDARECSAGVSGRVPRRPAFPHDRVYLANAAGVHSPPMLLPALSSVFPSEGLQKRCHRGRARGRGRLQRSGGRWLLILWRQLGSVPPPPRPASPPALHTSAASPTSPARPPHGRRPGGCEIPLCCAHLTLTACISLQAEQSSGSVVLLLVSLLLPKRVPFPLGVITQKRAKGTR